MYTRCSGGKNGRTPAPFRIKDGIHSPLLVPLPQMPEAGTTPPQPVDNRLDTLAPIQGQEGSSTVRDPLRQVAIREQGLEHLSIALA
jgi:hypothetical protein